MGERYALERGYNCQIFPARWDLHGKTAGFIRNEEMARYATEIGYKGVLIAFYGGNVSGGTKNMIDHAHRYGMYVYVVHYKDGLIQSSEWSLSKKQDDEYGSYPANQRYMITVLNSELPTGICLLSLLRDCECCEDVDKIYCYDKSQPCCQRQQISKSEGSYVMCSKNDFTGADAATTMSILNDLRAGRIKKEEIQPAIDALLKTTKCSDENFVHERISILSGILTGE